MAAKRYKKIKRLLLPLCYGIFLLGWLVLALVRFVGDGQRAELSVDIASAQPYGLETSPNGHHRSVDADPQLVFSPVDEEVRLVQLRVEFTLAPGEMELFYTHSEAQDFMVQLRAVGIPQDDGSWLYVLPAGHVHALRVDLGTTVGNDIAVRQLVLNPKMPASFYFVPGLRDVAAFLLLPALVCCVIYTLEGIMRYIYRAVNRLGNEKEPV